MKKVLLAFLGIVLLVAPVSESYAAEESGAPEGIYDNGLDGVYIDVNGAPYKAYAQKDYGSYAYTNEGCAWFACARAYELTGIDTSIWDGKSWYETQYAEYGYTRGQEPKAKALACYGWHVSVVEKVDGDMITISEGGYSPSDEPQKNGYTCIRRLSKEKLESENHGGFLGYVYLTEESDTKPEPPEDEDDGKDQDKDQNKDQILTNGTWKQDQGRWQYIVDEKPVAGRWVLHDGRQYYLKEDTYMATGWLWKDNDWYYLREDGAMAIGWAKVDTVWYYLQESGKMATGWITENGIRYYLSESGAMATGWVKSDNVWYYLRESGAMATGWEKVNDIWYYLRGDGKMATGWEKTDNVWYYLRENGAMATGWEKADNVWYYLLENGAMATGWARVNDVWYYLRENGAMAIGWEKVGNVWYYLQGNGAMAHDCWVGNYYVGSDGAMYVNAGTPDGYYVGADGAWIH